jgi:hypothetical protein
MSLEEVLKKGEEFLNQKNYFNAYQCFKHILALEPKNIKAHKGLHNSCINGWIKPQINQSLFDIKYVSLKFYL